MSIPPFEFATVTFLIADIRGYTAYTAEQGHHAAAMLSEHFLGVSRETLSAYGGEVFGSAGDQVLAAFRSSRRALEAAVALQARLVEEQAAHPDMALQAGVGLDAGEVARVGSDYRGNAINVAARLCAIAGPGEIFASDMVVGLAHRVEGLMIADRGEVTLKGLPRPVRVIQIASEGALPSSLPPLQPILVTHPTNLPDEPTPFIGREREIAEISGLLQQPRVRLLTLTGPGGSGKTRLALQVGNALLYHFSDGAFFVPLDTLSDPCRVLPTIAATLGITEESGIEAIDTVVNRLREKNLLLVLDNFEQVIDAAAVLPRVLDSCRGVHILVTSRVPLHLTREREYAVHPLSVPDPDRLPDLDSLSQYESVALFIERAQAVKPDFAITNENAPDVAEICHRLDGLPLALELAAARIKLLPPAALLQRLGNRLKLLTSGARDRPTRQQTLRAAIDWSYSLLSESERALFARLAVFVGGCNLEAIEAVCDPDGELDLLELVDSLVDKSLLRQEGRAEPRFRMLETIREYAADRLGALGASAALRAAHARYYIALGEEAHPHFEVPADRTWPDRLEAEHDNMRAALTHLAGAGDQEGGLLLASSIWRFWLTGGYIREGREWLERFLTLTPQPEATRVRVDALIALASTANQQGDLQVTRDVAQEAVEVASHLDYQRGLANALSVLGHWARARRDCSGAREYYERSLAISESLSYQRGIIAALMDLGTTASIAGDLDEARSRYEEALRRNHLINNRVGIAILNYYLGCIAYELEDDARSQAHLQAGLGLQRELGDRLAAGYSLFVLGLRALDKGAYGDAVSFLEEALRIRRDAADFPGAIARNLLTLARAAFGRGDMARARSAIKESLQVVRRIKGHRTLAEALMLLAAIELTDGQPLQAALLSGAASTLGRSASPEQGDAFGTPERDPNLPLMPDVLEEATAIVGAEAASAARTAGSALTPEQAVEIALSARIPPPLGPKDQPAEYEVHRSG